MLGEEAANDTVIVFIGAPFIGAKGVTVIDRGTLIPTFIMLHAVAIGELRAIVHGDTCVSF